MKIAIICSKRKDYNDQAKHSGYHFAWGFEDLGDSVDIFDHTEQGQIDPAKYDFFMSVDSSETYEIRDGLVPLVVYNGDTHMPMGLSRDRLRSKNAHIVFNGNVEYGRNLLLDEGIRSYWLPLGYDRRFDAYVKGTYKSVDVSMCGHENSPDRKALWDMLQKRYDARVGDMSASEYFEANKRAKIVVNQPTEPWDNIYNNRMIEGMACECLVLQKKIKTNAHKLLFEKDKEFVEWDDFIDLKEKIDYYLEHPTKRRDIATRAYEKVIKNFSYRDLCKVVKNYVFNTLI